ncbi:prephenate dehydrogenase [Chloroflexus islandicus]|uniref:Prephenate dehydrogenase n=1 Tax=Chloroflexus islandicus TaxID=1707952 RepID=A0A178MD76_9CHLR|nr:prephenate dehydrogenase/arogenate dehydrogenase family protein [Chloroflexus islandicus]OAN46476.1 prephenate dehydrogenase [Chloroflexus islandicus]
MIRIAIIGLGLIGASLGMALRNADPKESPLGAVEVIGFDREPRVIREARGRLAIDREARTLAEAVREAQMVVVATPVRAMQEVFRELATLLPAGVVVTDVASTKAQVCRWAAELLPRTVSFVGGHPMAGREKSGPAAADPDLFREAIYCLTATGDTAPQAIEAVEALVRAVGAKPYYIDPEEHDAYVAGISHLPLLLSVGLVTATGNSPAWKEMAPLAATGFRDVSRLASGDPQMQRDILLTNPHGLTRWIDELIRFLVTAREQINAGDAAAIEQMLHQAKATRDAWLESKPHLRPGEADFTAMPTVERPSLLGFRLPKREK